MKGAHYMYIHMYQKTIIFVINYLCVCVDRPYVCVFFVISYLCVCSDRPYVCVFLNVNAVLATHEIQLCLH